MTEGEKIDQQFVQGLAQVTDAYQRRMAVQTRVLHKPTSITVERLPDGWDSEHG